MPSKTTRELVDRLINYEIARAIAKHGSQEAHPDYMWALIAGEEMGEVHQAILQTGVRDDALNTNERVFDEVLQLASITTYWLTLMLERQTRSMGFSDEALRACKKRFMELQEKGLDKPS